MNAGLYRIRNLDCDEYLLTADASHDQSRRFAFTRAEPAAQDSSTVWEVIAIEGGPCFRIKSSQTSELLYAGSKMHDTVRRYGFTWIGSPNEDPAMLWKISPGLDRAGSWTIQNDQLGEFLYVGSNRHDPANRYAFTWAGMINRDPARLWAFEPVAAVADTPVAAPSAASMAATVSSPGLCSSHVNGSAGPIAISWASQLVAAALATPVATAVADVVGGTLGNSDAAAFPVPTTGAVSTPANSATTVGESLTLAQHPTGPPPSYEAAIGKQSSEVMKLTLIPEAAAAVAGEARELVVDVRCEASPAPRSELHTRPKIDLVLVLDVSGSMSGSGKLELSKKTLEFAIKDAKDTDRIGIVTYSDTAQTLFPLTTMSACNRAKALALVDTIKARGSTALCAGLVQGCREAAATTDGSTPAEVISVLMCTDGHANRGPRDASEIISAMRNPWAHCPEGCLSTAEQLLDTTKIDTGPNDAPSASAELQQKARKAAELRCDASVYTFGFGADHDEKLLRELADAGSGMYYHVESAEQIAESFADAIGGLSSTVAKGVRVELEAGPGATITKIWTAFEHAVASNGQSGWFKLGDIQESEKKDVLVTLALPVVDAVASPPVSTLQSRLAFVDITGVTPVPHCIEAGVDIARPSVLPTEIAAAGPNAEIRVQWARLRAVDDIKLCNSTAATGAIEEARTIATVAREEIRALAAELKAAGAASEVIDLLSSIDDDFASCIDGLSSQARYRSYGRFRMTQQVQSHTFMRSCDSADNYYSTRQTARIQSKARARTYMSTA